MASSVGLASIWRSTGRVSTTVGTVVVPFGFLVDRPRRKRRNDSRNVFFKDLRLDNGSPAPVKSTKINLRLEK